MKRIFPVLLSLAIFFASLFFPALHGEEKHLIGWVVGLLGFFSIPSTFAWLANLFYFAGCLCFFLESYRLSLILSIVGVFVGMDTFRLGRFPINEAGRDVVLDHVGLAFYLWEISFLVLAISSWR